MTKGDQGHTNWLQDINRGALNHVSCAPQLMSCNYCVCVCVYAITRIVVSVMYGPFADNCHSYMY